MVSGATAGATGSSRGMLAFLPLGSVTHSLVQMFLWEKFLERCPGYLYAHCTFQHVLPNQAGPRLGAACPTQSAVATGWPFPCWCRGVASCVWASRKRGGPQHNGSNGVCVCLLSSSGMRSKQTQLLVGDSGELSGGKTYHNKKAANTIG